MRRALLDVNVLIALLDADHVSHRDALSWFASNASHGWASCAITQNGCLRIMSSPGYPSSRPISQLAERLRDAAAADIHEQWPEDISILDADLIDLRRVHSARQLTDVYLLALAVRHGGCLVTFDKSIIIDAVRGATRAHLVLL